MKMLCALLFLCSLGACANPYQTFYSASYGKPYLYPEDIIPYEGEPNLIRLPRDEMTDFAQIMTEDGFIFLGYSSFTAPDVSISKLSDHAKYIKAHTAAYSIEYVSSTSTSIPVTTPSTQVTSHSGSLYSSNNYGSYYGSSTTYGTTTTYIPITSHRYSYEAWYWAKRKEGGLGIEFDRASDEVELTNGTNKGAMVTAVVRGSAAFKADILKGDLIRKIGDYDIIDYMDLDDAVNNCMGKHGVDVVLYRKGEKISKIVDIIDHGAE